MFNRFRNLMLYGEPEVDSELKTSYKNDLLQIKRQLLENRIKSDVIDTKIELLERTDIPEFEFEKEYFNLIPILTETIQVYNRSVKSKEIKIKFQRNVKSAIKQLNETNLNLIAEYDHNQLDSLFDSLEENKPITSVDEFFKREPKVYDPNEDVYEVPNNNQKLKYPSNESFFSEETEYIPISQIDRLRRKDSMESGEARLQSKDDDSPFEEE